MRSLSAYTDCGVTIAPSMWSLALTRRSSAVRAPPGPLLISPESASSNVTARANVTATTGIERIAHPLSVARSRHCQPGSQGCQLFDLHHLYCYPAVAVASLKLLPKGGRVDPG